jgi:quercetin dioxygenase-like cupin family protein
MALQGKLSHPNRFITTHDESGKAIIDESIPAPAPFYSLGTLADPSFAHCYVTSEFPVKIADGADTTAYRNFLDSPPGLTVSGGTVLRYVDMPPGAVSPMHRTVSLDYGVVLEGEVDLVLDSGETRAMKRGDVCVQRATMHAWKNRSETEWVRMLYILQPVQPLQVAGKELKEDYGGMEGVKRSE